MDAPPAARAQLDELTNGLRAILRDALVGVYVHGSLALGCFNEARSDIDVLVVTDGALSEDEKLSVLDVSLRTSAMPYGLEVDVLTTDQLRSWRHPSPFELHFWEGRREDFAFDPLGTLESIGTENPDLAAHVTIARARAIPLLGPPADEVFPRVPATHLRDSLLRDLEWSRSVCSALYGVLSPCRVWAALETGEVHSKETGAAWALEHLPADLRPLVERALASYSGTGEPIVVDEQERQRLIDFVDERLRR